MTFGLGVSRIDSHVWLYSNGGVYEAHWDKEGKDIFESTPLMLWPWVDNIVVVPPDQITTISTSKIRECTE